MSRQEQPGGREQALAIADAWLDGRMNSLVQMIPGDPDCDAVILARQYVRLREVLVDVIKYWDIRDPNRQAALESAIKGAKVALGIKIDRYGNTIVSSADDERTD